MPFPEALRLALQAIWGAKLRSFFTLLGIIVSVGFLVVVVAVIQGMNAYVKENLTGAMIGTNAFQVRRSPISVGLLDDEQVRGDRQAAAHLARRTRRWSQRALPDAKAVSLQSGWPTPISDVVVPRPHGGQRADLRRHPALPDRPGLPDARRRAAHRARRPRAAARGGDRLRRRREAVRPARPRRGQEGPGGGARGDGRRA